MSHGAVERVYQKSMFANVTSDKKFNKTSHCSGHSAYAVKAWLSGFYFVDESVDAGTLTNQELTNILDPNSVEYRDLINFVYDKASFDHCSDSTAWFS